MSLFNDLQWEIIEKPTNTNYYHRILNEQKEEKKTEKQKRKEMREKLWPVEYKKRYDKQRYKKQRKLFKQRYEEHRDAFNESMLNEIIDELWPGNDITNRDKYYTEKFRDDDTVKRGYRFAWRSSKLANLNWKSVPKWKKPFRISNRRSMEYSMRLLHDIQCEVYEYLLPHMDEIKDCRVAIYKKQRPYDFPLWYIEEPLKTLASWLDMNPARVVNIADAMIRGKFMVSELYLWRTSFIFWDVLVTQTGNTYRIALEDNLPWLTKDTVEDIHSLRMEWRKHKWEVAPPIYIVNDAYLIKVQPNERETLFYIVPT